MAAAFLVHVGSLSAGFVHDDHRFVEHNPAIRSIDPVAYFRDPSTASKAEGIQPDIWRPLRTLGYAVDHAVFGTRAWAWHLENLLWHALNAFLVFRLLLPLLRGRVLPALAGALFFGVHPVTSESVAWISSRGDLMAITFLLASLLVLEREGLARTLGGGALMLLACLSKESAVVLPLLLPLRDLALPRETAPRRVVTAWRTGFLLLVAVGYFLWRSTVLADLSQLREFPGGGREATGRGMLAGLAWYAGALVWPEGFRFDFFLPIPFSWDEPAVVLGAGLLVTLVLLGVRGLLTRRALVAFASLGALAALLPVSNVVVPLKALVAERFLYPVLVCAAAGVGAVLVAPKGRMRFVATAAVALVLFAFVPVTWTRDRAWASEETLWDAVRHDRPAHPRSYEGLGFVALQDQPPRLREAEQYYRSYLEHNPDDGKSWMLLGQIFGALRRSLRREDEPGVETDIAVRRHEAARAELGAYHAALAAWGRAGFGEGRGSPEMLREVERRRRDAAFDLGDLLEAKRANDGLIRLQGLDPADPGRVLRDSSRETYDLRRARVALALEGTRPAPRLTAEELERLAREAPERLRLLDRRNEQRRETRRVLLADVGVEDASDESVLARLEPLLEGLLRERPDDGVTKANLDLLRQRLRGGPR